VFTTSGTFPWSFFSETDSAAIKLKQKKFQDKCLILYASAQNVHVVRWLKDEGVIWYYS